jgi:hypothetical protein
MKKLLKPRYISMTASKVSSSVARSVSQQRLARKATTNDRALTTMMMMMMMIKCKQPST